jgi:hypothetical protein
MDGWRYWRFPPIAVLAHELITKCHRDWTIARQDRLYLNLAGHVPAVKEWIATES